MVYRHIVMFKLVEFASENEKYEKFMEIRNALETLMDKIDFLRGIRVSYNKNPAEHWDICLENDLDSLEDIKAYGAHPAHQAIVKSLIKPVIVDRACVDYQYEKNND